MSCRTDTPDRTNSQNFSADFDLLVYFISVDSSGRY